MSERITWRGMSLAWINEAHPKFSNRDVNDRAAYCEASPVGTRWDARLKIERGGTRLEGVAGGATPQEALNNALDAMRGLLGSWPKAEKP